MSNELVNPVVEATIEKVRTDGTVMLRNERSLLAGPYRWQAGLFHLIHDHVRVDGNEWCTMECFARFLFKTAHAGNVSSARERVAPLARSLLDVGEFLVVTYDGDNGAKNAMRILLSTDDPVVATQQIERMVRMRDMSAERADAALRIIRAKSQQKPTAP